jgi:hypothetical protein
MFLICLSSQFQISCSSRRPLEVHESSHDTLFIYGEVKYIEKTVFHCYIYHSLTNLERIDT